MVDRQHTEPPDPAQNDPRGAAAALAFKGLLGRVLGQSYQIDRLIGVGRTFVVFAATDLTTRTPVALKLLRPERAAQPDVIDRLAHHAARLITLQHPHCAQVFGWKQADSFHFLVMELLPEGSLAMLPRRYPGGRVPLALLLPILRQVAQALDAAHQFGLLHAGLRPELITLGQRGEDLHFVKVAGFRLSAPLPAYSAPEQARGEPPSPRTDQFALATILYGLLTGRQAFSRREDEPPSLVLERVQHEDPPTFNFPERVEAALSKAMSRSSASRFSSVGEFVRALDDPPPPTRLTPVAPTPGAAAPVTSYRKAIALGLGAGLLFCAALYGLWRWHRPPAARSAPFEGGGSTPLRSAHHDRSGALLHGPGPAQPPAPKAQPPAPTAQPPAPTAQPPAAPGSSTAVKRQPPAAPPPSPALKATPALTFTPALDAALADALRRGLSACLTKAHLPESYTIVLHLDDYLVPSEDAPQGAKGRDFRECVKVLGPSAARPNFPATVTIKRGRSRP